jgi:hypothetical protein
MESLYRSARAEKPWLRQRSFWTLSKHEAKLFAEWEQREAPQLGPSRIYETQVNLHGDHVLDLRPLGPLDPDRILELHPEDDSYQWVLVLEGPLKGRLWQVAVYLGEEPIEAWVAGES